MSTFDRYLPTGLALFVRGWVADPRAVGAVAPSGRHLAKLMTRSIEPDSTVLELGPGTGTFTRAILARGVAPERFAAIELNASFARRLKRDYPQATVVCGDAGSAHAGLEPLRGGVDVIVSGLPLVLFGREQRLRLLRQSFAMLKPGGTFFQFTYGGRCPVVRAELEELCLEAKRIGTTLLNIPPAFVYRLNRAA